MLNKKYLLFIVLILFISNSFCQNSLNFYGNTVQLPVVTSADQDSFFTRETLPVSIKNFINATARQYNLEDWAIVLFLNKYVAAQFSGETDANKVKIMAVLLSAENINNAIGTRDKDHLQTLISVKNDLSPFIYTFDQNGYRLVLPLPSSRPMQLRKVDIGFYKGKDITFAGKLPQLNINDYKALTRTFYNYKTNRPDSFAFTYSPQFIKFSTDFPMLLADRNYEKYPVSPMFATTLFKELDKRVAYCTTKLDSINFLLRFAQTSIKNELNYITYGANGYPSFPENTLVIGKGDSQDKSALFGYLFKHYFKNASVVLIYYTDHLRVGIADVPLSIDDNSFVEFNGKRYFVADLTNTLPLGDGSYKLLKTPPDISLN